MDDDEDGFECILQRKVALEERKEDGPDTTWSPAKLTVPTSDNATNQRVITPSSEETMKYSRKSRLKKLSRKMSFIGSIF
jgi:hypothetical protein